MSIPSRSLDLRSILAHPWWLRLARVFIIAYAVFQLGAAVVGTALFPAYLRENLDTFTANDSWTVTETSAALQELSWPASTIGWVDLSRDWLFLLATYFLAYILLRQKYPNGFRLFLALVFLLNGSHTGSAMEPALQAYPLLHEIFHTIIGAVSWQFFFIIFYLFPTGSPSPSWTRWMVRAWLGFMVITQAFPRLWDRPVLSDISIGLAIVFVLSAIGSQVYRQFRGSGPIQKQQTKWVVASLVFSGLWVFPAATFAFQPPSPQSLGSDLILALLFQIGLDFSIVLVYASILIAILRYRLYDIDLIIRRTMVYGALTILLGLVYLGGITVLQGLFSAASGQTTPLAIVLSTLAIAALFSPLRRRIQDFIDRRFYRRKYNAEQALDRFADVARHETDVEVLTNRLLGVVKDTVQPEHASLWLKTGKTSEAGQPATRIVEA